MFTIAKLDQSRGELIMRRILTVLSLLFVVLGGIPVFTEQESTSANSSTEAIVNKLREEQRLDNIEQRITTLERSTIELQAYVKTANARWDSMLATAKWILGGIFSLLGSQLLPWVVSSLRKRKDTGL